MTPMSCWSRHPEFFAHPSFGLSLRWLSAKAPGMLCSSTIEFQVEASFLGCLDSCRALRNFHVSGILSVFRLVPYQYTIRNHAHHWFQMMINKHKAKNWSRVSPAEPYGATLWKPTSFGHVFAVNFIEWHHQLTKSTLFTGKQTFRKAISQHPTRVKQQRYVLSCGMAAHETWGVMLQIERVWRTKLQILTGKSLLIIHCQHSSHSRLFGRSCRPWGEFTWNLIQEFTPPKSNEHGVEHLQNWSKLWSTQWPLPANVMLNLHLWPLSEKGQPSVGSGCN